MLQAPRIVRWTLPALLLTLVVGGALIIALSGRGDTPAPQAGESSAPATTTARRQSSARRMTVRRGDTPTSIALRAEITLLELLKLNPRVDPRALRPGQKLKVSP